MIENGMINYAVKNFSDSKEASNYFISDLVLTWKSSFEYHFNDFGEYLDFMYRYHYIFKSWERELIKIKKPTQRLIMSRFLMMVYHFENLIARGVFDNVYSPSDIFKNYYHNKLY